MSESDKKGDSKSRDEARKNDNRRSDSKLDRRGSDRRRRTKSRSRHRSRSRDRLRSSSSLRSKSKESKKRDASKEKARVSDAGSDKKIKSLEELKKERQVLIEKERKLREERRKKERDRERELREERRKAQEARERERRERAKKEEERMKRERDRQREIERERELRKKRERERLAQERREKEREREEKERLEKERKERASQLERERQDRERLRREREERERLEDERHERERKERERVERERLRKEKEELERIKTERERLERERLEVERRYALKRGSASGKRESEGGRTDERYMPDLKKPSLESPKGQGGRPYDFFGGTHNIRDMKGPDFSQSRVEDKVRLDGSRHSSRDGGHKRGSLPKGAREASPLSFTSGRGRDKSPMSISSSDARKIDYGHRNDGRGGYSLRDHRRVVSSREERDRSPRKPDIPRDVDRRLSDRGSARMSRHSDRDGIGIQYYGMDEKVRDRNWEANQEYRNPPKTLNEILERAGVSGILGSAAFDQKVTMTVNDALSIAGSRMPKGESSDWRSGHVDDRHDKRGDDRRDSRRDERRDDRRSDRLEVRRSDWHDDHLTGSGREVRISRDQFQSEQDSHLPARFSHADNVSRRQDIDVGISRRAQELLAQAALPDSRSRLPPTHPLPSRDIAVRDQILQRAAMQKEYPQRGSELQVRDSFSRNTTRSEVSARGFPGQSAITQQVIPGARQHQHAVVPTRPSSQDNWNRSRNVIQSLGAPGNFQLTNALIGSAPVRGQALSGRDIGKPGLPPGHGIPSHIRRF